MKDMKPIVRVGVNLVEGCTITGGETAIERLSEDLAFAHVLETNPKLHAHETPLYLRTIVDLSQRLKAQVQAIHQANQFPLVFGGDHALAIGSIAGSLCEDLAVLWIDAHGDCNTPDSSTTQRIHGMPLATLMHHGHPDLVALSAYPIPAQNVLLIGVRDLDEAETRLMNQWGVRYIRMSDIHEYGIPWLTHEVLAFTHKHQALHISFDCDSMEPSLYPGVNTDVADGFVYKELQPLLSQLLSLPQLRSMDIVEYNPVRDNGATHRLILTLDELIHQVRTTRDHESIR